MIEEQEPGKNEIGVPPTQRALCITAVHYRNEDRFFEDRLSEAGLRWRVDFNYRRRTSWWLDVDCDIWIPAARPDVVRADNVHRLKTRLMAQGANIPCTAEAESALHKRGVLVIPDFIANAGGVICAAIEFQGGTERAAFEGIDQRIRANTRLVIEESRRTGDLPRAAAVALAARRLRDAAATRRWR